MASTAIATTSSRPYDPGTDHWAQHAVPGAKPHGIRQDGWTPFRQQVFLRALAEGQTVELACAGVGLSVASAYALRNRANGAAFALGWAAARLLARERIADTLLTRALHGQIETVTRSDGVTVDRLRYDNRLAMGLLTRLDREATSNAAGAQAARLVAQEFEAFTDAIARDDSPARAGLFLGTRAVGEAQAELAPVVALARADRFARSGAGLATEIDTADLDLAARADWSADQWRRADAAGLLAVSAAATEAADRAGRAEQALENAALSHQFPQLRIREEGLPPVWEDEELGPVTDFPPPEGFDGVESGVWGEQDYGRTLTDAEEAAWQARPEDARLVAARAIDAATRDRFFGFDTVVSAPAAPPETQGSPGPRSRDARG